MTDKGDSCFVCRSLSLLPAEFSTISLTAAITLRRAKACQKRRQEDYHRQRIREDTGYWQACVDSPRKWRAWHPEYWQNYHAKHPGVLEQNHRKQHQSAKGGDCPSYKQQLSFPASLCSRSSDA